MLLWYLHAFSEVKFPIFEIWMALKSSNPYLWKPSPYEIRNPNFVFRILKNWNQNLKVALSMAFQSASSRAKGVWRLVGSMCEGLTWFDYQQILHWIKYSSIWDCLSSIVLVCFLTVWLIIHTLINVIFRTHCWSLFVKHVFSVHS